MTSMEQPALTPGMVVPRKRALFGLLDADGWGWATVKAGIWLTIMILVLGYIPDRAYYLTVSRTVDLGVLAWSPINLCPPENLTLPCPAPVGSVVPWQASPPEVALPAGRTGGDVVQVGTKLLYIGGTDGTTPQAMTYVSTVVGTSNFGPWAEGPALPAPRADAAVIFVSGSIYVVGGRGEDGQPATTTYSLTPNGDTGDLGAWTEVPDLVLPEGLAGAAPVATADGLLLVGGSNASGPVTTVLKSKLSTQGALQKWEAEAALPAARTGAAAAIEGDYVWLYGGSDASGPTAAVERGAFGLAAAEGLPKNPDEGKVISWESDPTWNVPAARADASTWAANGAIYLAGGTDGSTPQTALYWAAPSNDGVISEWKHLDVSDLPVGLQGGGAVISGPNAIIVGGTTTEGVQTGSWRGNIAPQAPFFRLGLVGATVPGLQIEGEIGQQLGYLNAAGAGTLGFVIMLLIGWGFAHKAQARAFLQRLFRR